MVDIDNENDVHEHSILLKSTDSGRTVIPLVQRLSWCHFSVLVNCMCRRLLLDVITPLLLHCLCW